MQIQIGGLLRNKWYLRLLYYVAAAIILTILAVSSILYFQFERITLKREYENTTWNLSQLARDSSLMIETATAISTQIYKDGYVAKLLYDPAPTSFEMAPAMAQLTSYSMSIPYIDSIYIYNPEGKRFYSVSKTSSEIADYEKFGDLGAKHIIENIDQYGLLRPIPRIAKIEDPYFPKNENYYSFIHYNRFLNNDSIIMLNISERWLKQSIQDQSGSRTPVKEIMIINSAGTLISDTSSSPFLSDVSQEGYMQKIIRSSGPSYFVDQVGGERALISYSEPDTNGWRYVQISRYEDLISGLTQQQRNTLIAVGLFLLVGATGSIALSGRLYLPMRSLFSRLNTLEYERKNSYQRQRADYLKSIVLDRDAAESDVLDQTFSTYHYAFRPADQVQILLLRIDDYKNFIANYSLADRNLLKYSISNIAQELCSKRYAAEAVELGDDQVLVILGNPVQTLNEKPELEALVRNIQTTVRQIVKLSVSASVSHVSDGAESLSHLYTIAVEALRHRLFLGQGCIIRHDYLETLKNDLDKAPEERMKQMIDALLLGNTNEMYNHYGELKQLLSGYSYAAASLAIHQMTYKLNQAFQIISKHQLKEMTSATTLEIPLQSIEVWSEVDERIQRAVSAITERIEDKKTSKYTNLVDDIQQLIATQYANPDLSLDTIAAQLGYTAKYLSKIYKQYTLKTIMDSVNEYRLAAAKSLLVNSDLSVSEVSERTGYMSSSYFHKTFKKNTGVTPNEFRKNTQAPY